MNACILSIGDELTTGQSVDTNSAWLSDKLLQRGIFTIMHMTVADDRQAITKMMRDATAIAELVIVTGGLGPTEDDLTRYCLADLMGVGLDLDERSCDRIAAFFRQRNREMPKVNEIQAMCPVGATLLDNNAGTAPGIRATVGQTDLWCLPGVPSEMKLMYEQHIAPALPASAGRTILTALIHTFGIGESTLGPILGELMARDRNPTVGTTAKQAVVSVRVRSVGDNPTDARQKLDDTVAQIEQRLGNLIFGRDDDTPAVAVGRLLKDRNQHVATAESCTGGLIGKMLTDTPGSSDYYKGGWVTYTNAMKQSQLGVPGDLLEQHGAVSEPVAIAMADGALERSGADYAIAVTGIAGPSGGSEDKPVGTVWIALATRGQTTAAELHNFPYDRDTVRMRTAHHALNMLRMRLLGD